MRRMWNALPMGCFSPSESPSCRPHSTRKRSHGRDRLIRSGPAFLPAAVLFDFDGTLADTEPIHLRAFQDVFSPHGIRIGFREYLATYVGLDDRDAIRAAFKDRALLRDEMDELVARKGRAFLAAAASAQPYPGMRTWLRFLRGRVPLALCSGALPTDIAPILRRFKLGGLFDVVVTAADVRQSKPHPQSYRLAIRRLRRCFPERHFPSGRCLAVEDTVAGIRSAKAAGLKVLALAHTHPARDLSEADYCLESFAGISPLRFFSQMS